MRIIFLAILFIAVKASANPYYIDINKISDDKKYFDAFEFIKENVGYYNHWTPNWDYDKDKGELTAELINSYKLFSDLKNKEAEVNLLLGDIAHYLYNMDNEEYHEKAEKHYNAAMNKKPKDYRGYWFLARHYGLANVIEGSVEYFLKAETLLPDHVPADYWEDYAFTMSLANMPSHSIYAMDKSSEILGVQGDFEMQLGPSIKNRIDPVDVNKNYEIKEIWSAQGEEEVQFVSRALGIKLLVDSSWAISLYDYKDHQTVVTLGPQRIESKKGVAIGYSIAILIKVPEEGDKLEDYLKPFIDKYTTKNKIKFSDKYAPIAAYEITDKTVYQDIGGGHMYLIGMEREMPKYPGLVLESPMSIESNGEGGLQFYRASQSKARFEGRIFYAILLDTCEDIFVGSNKIFKDFFENRLTIE